MAIPSAFWSRISIHTTRVGGDIYNVDNILEEFRISIHTTRVGGDSIRSTDFSTFWNFNPHHPCGWWLNLESFKDWKTLFQSTPPVWVVTIFRFWCCSSYTISIHTTRVGGDPKCLNKGFIYKLFQSTPPVWVVTSCRYTSIFICRFQSTPPVWVVTLVHWNNNANETISIHTTRVGGDVRTTLIEWFFVHFNPHHPCGWWLIACGYSPFCC